MSKLRVDYFGEEKSANESAALLDVREAATLLHLSPGTLYHMVADGRVPCIRLSRRCLRFRRSDLDVWVTEHFQPGENVAGR